MSKYNFVSGDTGSKLVITCINDSDVTAINLTGGSVKIEWNDSSGVKQSRTMTITNATSGIVEYQFLATELFSPRMLFQIVITDALSNVIKNLALLEIPVREVL